MAGSPGSRSHARVDADILARLAVLEEKIVGYPPREWVKDYINQHTRPQAEAILRMEQTVKQLSEDASTLFAAHDKMLQDRAQREKEEHDARLAELRSLKDSRSLKGIARVYGPLLGFITGLIVLITMIRDHGDKLLNWLFGRYAS